ncbi:nuclear transport factor 2 family protein [Microbacterium sp. NPDC058345]|uniref:nuclear transport factor 2 family protein n=1 Tax=Microbacterium sp. NPDC058345 TaxID=3346455 RepID=UPI0036534670
MTAFELERILDVERQGWDALCAARGGTHYRELMTADAVMVLVNGMVLDRDAVAASLDDAPPWRTYTLTDPRLVRVGEDAVALVYRARAERADDEEPFRALMTSVYARTDDGLRLALYQQTADHGPGLD